MKKIKQSTTILILLFVITSGHSQKVAVIGMNHLNPDGFAFVAIEDLPASEVVYFSEDEYNNTTDVFSSGESVVQYTATSPIPKGDVVFVREIATNVFNVSCTNNVGCGSATEVSPGGSFALASGGEHLYAYSDTDNDPTNGVTEIYAVMYTLQGSIASIEDPSVDYSDAIVVDGFASDTPNRTEYVFSPATLRDGVAKADLEKPLNYLNGHPNNVLSLVAFTGSCALQDHDYKVWTGSTGTTDWFDPLNWNEASIPTLSDAVCIPSQPTGGQIFPVLTSDASIWLLWVQEGAVIEVLEDVVFTVLAD